MKTWIFIAAINGMVAVAMGAVGSHVLGHLGEDRLHLLTLGSNYQLWHALGLVGVGLLAPYMKDERALHLHKAAGTAFTLGIILFSGGLYVMALTGPGVVQWLVPVGGSLLILGWIGLSICAFYIKPTMKPSDRQK